MSAILLRQKLLPVPLKVTELENMELSFNIETTDQNALDMIKLKSLPLFTLVTFVYQVIMTRQSFTPAIMKADTGSLVTWY